MYWVVVVAGGAVLLALLADVGDGVVLGHLHPPMRLDTTVAELLLALGTP